MNQKGVANLVLVGVVVVLAVLGGYFALSRQTSKLVNVPTEWKTYINDNPSFSFNYPASWKEPTLNQLGTRNSITFQNGLYIEVGFWYNQADGRNIKITELVNSIKTVFQNVQIQDIKIDGHSAVKITYSNEYYGENNTDVYIYQDNNNSDEFIHLTVNHSLVDASVLDQILSTFKFTEQTVQGDTSNWKLYPNINFPVYYDSSWIAAPIMYRNAAQEGAGEPAMQTGVTFTLPSGASIGWGGPQSSCNQSDLNTADYYGVSAVACVKGMQANLSTRQAKQT